MRKVFNYTKMTGDARRILILEALAKGLSLRQVIDKFTKEWNISEKNVIQYIKKSIEYVNTNEYKDMVKSINIERLDKLFSDLVKDGDKKTAIKAIDTQNKLIGAYEDKVNISSDEVSFTFNVL